MSINAFPYGHQQQQQLHQIQQQPPTLNPAMLSQPTQQQQQQQQAQSQSQNPTPTQMLAAGGGIPAQQRFSGQNVPMMNMGMMQTPSGMNMPAFNGMGNFGAMGGMGGMANMGMAIGPMGAAAAMGGMHGVMNGAPSATPAGPANSINPSVVMNGSTNQQNGMSTINPALLSSSSPVAIFGDVFSNPTIFNDNAASVITVPVSSSSPPLNTSPTLSTSRLAQHPFSGLSYSGYPAQLAALSSHDLQLMQERAIARRQAALAGMGEYPFLSFVYLPSIFPSFSSKS